jgi:hypothetical protein
MDLHYTLMMLDLDIFDRPTMSDRTLKPSAQQKFAFSVPYFEAKVAALEKYTTGSGDIKNHPFATATAATEIQGQIKDFVEMILLTNKERALAAHETR